MPGGHTYEIRFWPWTGGEPRVAEYATYEQAREIAMAAHVRKTYRKIDIIRVTKRYHFVAGYEWQANDNAPKE